MQRILLYSVITYCVLANLSACRNGEESRNSITPIIKAWKRTDNMQTIAAGRYTNFNYFNRDTVLLLRTLEELDAAITDQSALRLRVRKLLFEATWKHRLQLAPEAVKQRLIEKAISLAYSLKDNFLFAELYEMMAEIKNFYPIELMFYSLKSAELQEKIGLQYTKPIQNVFYNVSAAAHNSQDFRMAISYGLRGLEFWGSAADVDGRLNHAHTLDILGDAYKRLGKYDSSFYYYRQMDSLVQQPISSDSIIQILYRGIASGNKGELLGLLGNYKEAYPLLNDYLQLSRDMDVPLNIAQAANAIGNLQLLQQEPEAARRSFAEAYQQTNSHLRYEVKMHTAAGLADAYEAQGLADSAYYFYRRSIAFRDTLQQQFTQSLYDKAKVQLDFSNAQHQVDIAEASLKNTQRVRNVILFAAILVFVIIVLLANRQRLKQKIKEELRKQEYERTKTEIDQAKNTIDQFVTSIREKNDIILSLEGRLRQQGRVDEAVPENLLKHSLVSEDGWMAFKEAFKKAYPLFLHHFQQKLGHVTTGEERLSTLIYLKLDNYQVANTLGISKDSVARSKRRLAKRLDLPASQSLDDFIYSLG